jgi:hypothetical protein
MTGLWIVTAKRCAAPTNYLTFAAMTGLWVITAKRFAASQ